jgi:hypothetical protein
MKEKYPTLYKWLWFGVRLVVAYLMIGVIDYYLGNTNYPRDAPSLESRFVKEAFRDFAWKNPRADPSPAFYKSLTFDLYFYYVSGWSIAIGIVFLPTISSRFKSRIEALERGSPWHVIACVAFLGSVIISLLFLRSVITQ